jgi:hypothetical protein
MICVMGAMHGTQVDVTPGLDNIALEFHDSEIAHASVAGTDLLLTFSAAYVHRSSGTPGVDSGQGYLAPLVLAFRGAQFTGDLPRCIGRLSDGRMAGADIPRGLLPLPFTTTNPVHAQLQFTNGATLDVHAAGMDCRITGEERFVESYAC